jgi:hypothetical protein
VLRRERIHFIHGCACGVVRNASLASLADANEYFVFPSLADISQSLVAKSWSSSLAVDPMAVSRRYYRCFNIRPFTTLLFGCHPAFTLSALTLFQEVCAF